MTGLEESMLDDARYYLDQAEKNVVEQGGRFVAFAFVMLPGEDMDIRTLFKLPAGMDAPTKVAYIKAACDKAVAQLEMQG